jgi:hypothetical protein
MDTLHEGHTHTFLHASLAYILIPIKQSKKYIKIKPLLPSYRTETRFAIQIRM